MSVEKMYESLRNTPTWDEGTKKIIKAFDKTLTMLKTAHPNKYRDIKMDLYVALNGYHFTEDMLKDATEHMINDNGTVAPKWSVSETTQVAKNAGIGFGTFNEYDWNYVMNMIYSDYCEVLGDNVSSYTKMAEKFLHDKDAPEGKALKYYMSMKY